MWNPRVSPTSLPPGSGASSALLGKQGAMACTVAVEESISEHYNSQIRALMEADPDRYTELLQASAHWLLIRSVCCVCLLLVNAYI